MEKISSLAAFGLDRHLLGNEVGFSKIRDEVFKKALKKDVQGNKPNAAEDGFRGRQEIITTNGHKCVPWSVERLKKILDNDRRFNLKMWVTCHAERCPDLLYEEYRYVANRPAEMCQKDSPFWLAVNYRLNEWQVSQKPKNGRKEDSYVDQVHGCWITTS